MSCIASHHSQGRFRTIALRLAPGMLLLALGWFARNLQADWPRHTVDDSSRGADGVRLADVNGDGRPDIVTGWEEAGVVRVCFHPGPGRAGQRWPARTVAVAAAPEDAFAADLDGDGRPDVISCHEGREQTVRIAWQPNSLDDDRPWPGGPIPVAEGVSRWMYALSLQIDNRHGPDLVVGSKGEEGAIVAWLEAPANPRDLSAWKLHPIESAGWIMTLDAIDMNRDGRTDLLVTDRKGDRRGVYWLEPQDDSGRQWQRHDIGLNDHEVMFADTLERHSRNPEVWVATRNGRLFRASQARGGWRLQSFANPFGVKTGKAVALGHQSDGTLLLAHTSNTIDSGQQHQTAAVAMTRLTPAAKDWKLGEWEDVSGKDGIKFDQAEWIDMDSDGDLDLLTCEERDNLGVIWYEQP